MRCSVSSPDGTPRRELKYDAQRRIIDELQGVCVECLILLSNKMILEGEIKDAKISSFSSDFQTPIKH